MIDFGSLMQDIFEGAVQALGEGAHLVEGRAKQKAPVRRLFGDGGQAIRIKSISEIETVRSTRDAVFKAGGPPTVIQPEAYGEARTVHGKKPPIHWRQRRMAAAQHLLGQYDAEMSNRRAGLAPHKTMLTRRGAYEVRSKRAAFATWQHLSIGGRLRGEIFSTSPTVSGNRAEAWVISPTEYAKYQEFGTRHNAAHPFLRPAAEESRGEVVALIADAVRGALPHGGANVEIEVVVRL